METQRNMLSVVQGKATTAVTFSAAHLQPALAGNALAFTKEVRVVKTIAVNLPNKGDPDSLRFSSGRTPGPQVPSRGSFWKPPQAGHERSVERKMEMP